MIKIVYNGFFIYDILNVNRKNFFFSLFGVIEILCMIDCLIWMYIKIVF